MQEPASPPPSSGPRFPADSPLAEPRPRAVTWRSILIGLLGTILICGISPYNDWAVANTLVIGNFLPIGLVLFMLVLILLINAPLHRLAPRTALREGELAIILAMLLAACSLPSSGLMRYLPSSVVAVYTAATERFEHAEILRQTGGVPRWLLPDIDPSITDPVKIGEEPVIKAFYSRSTDRSVPWLAWIRPMTYWGVFVALLWGLMIFLTLIVRRQWAENERLAFPLATVYSSLIEAPRQGHAFNALFRSAGFWIAASTVFIWHGFNGLNIYFPSFPEIPRSFDFISRLTDAPWAYTAGDFRKSEIYFSIVGVTYFLQSKIGFSLWAMFVLLQGVNMLTGSLQIQFTEQMKQDQTFGGLVVLSGVILYIGRAHWWMVIRHMFRQARPGESESRYLPYAFAGWGAVFCWFGVMGFLMAMGASPAGALLISLVLVMMLMMVARIVAETGLIFVQINWLMHRTWYYPLSLDAEAFRTTPRTFFITTHMSELFHDLRESFAAFFSTGTRLADQSAYERSRRWRTGVSYVLAIGLTLFVGYWVSAASMLWTEYNYAASYSKPPEAPINNYGVNVSPRVKMLEVTDFYLARRSEGNELWIQATIGGLVVGVLSILRLTLAWWPLHPIAFIVLYSWALHKIWFSILIGWLAKVIMVRFGGASLLKLGRSFFIGLVIGEASAAAFWMVFSLCANWMGYEYHRIVLLPY